MEGAGTAALEDCADPDGDGLALRFNLQLLHHALDHLLAPGVAPHLTNWKRDNLHQLLLTGLHCVVDNRLTTLLGGNTKVKGKLNLLGRRRLRGNKDLALMVADRRKASMSETQGASPAEVVHVEGVVVQVAELLKHVARSKVRGLSLVHQFHVETSIVPKLIILCLPLATTLHNLEALGIEDRSEVKHLLDSRVGTDLVVDELNLANIPVPLRELKRHGQLSLAHISFDRNIKGNNKNSLLINASVDHLTNEGDQGSNTASHALVNKSLKGCLSTTFRHIYTATATEGYNSGPPHLSIDREAKVGWNHLFIRREIHDTLPVEGVLARESLLQKPRIFKDILQVLNTTDREASKDGGVLKQPHEEEGFWSSVLAHLNPQLLNGLSPLMTEFALNLLARGLSKARQGLIECGDNITLVKADFNEGIPKLLCHKELCLVMVVGRQDGILRRDPVDSALIANLEHGEELAGKDSSSGGKPATSLLDQRVDDPCPPDENCHIRGKVLHADLVGEGVKSSVDGTKDLSVLLIPAEGSNLLDNSHVRLQGHDDIEGSNPDVSGFICVAVDGRNNWEYLVRMDPTNTDQGVHTEVPCGMVVMLTAHDRALKVALQDIKNNRDNLLMGKDTKGNNDGILVLHRHFTLVQLAPQVRNPPLGDDGAVLVTKSAKNLAGIVLLSQGGDTGLLQEAAEAENGHVPDIALRHIPNGLTPDKLKEVLKKLGGGHDNGPGQGKEDGGHLAASQLTSLNKRLEEPNRLWLTTHDNGVNKDVLGNVLLLTAVRSNHIVIYPTEHGPVKHCEGIGEGENLPRHLRFREDGGVEKILLNNVLNKTLGLGDKFI